MYHIIKDLNLNLRKILDMNNILTDMFAKEMTKKKLKLYMVSTGLLDTWREGAD